MTGRTRAAVGAALTLIGLFLTFLSFLPDVSVETYQSLNPSDPFATFYRVSNNWICSIKNVQPSCFALSAIGPRLNASDDLSQVISDTVPELAHGGRTTASCPFGGQLGGAEHAEILIRVVYRPWPFWTRTKAVCFRGMKNASGDFVWLDEACPANALSRVDSLLQDFKRFQP